MDTFLWARPVLLERFGSPGVLTISTLETAARLILQVPAEDRGTAQVEALRTFRDVLKCKAGTSLARADFINAAMEAGYFVLPETFFDQPALIVNQPPASQPTVSRLAKMGTQMRVLSAALGKRLAKALSHMASVGTMTLGKVLHGMSLGVKQILARRSSATEPVLVWM